MNTEAREAYLKLLKWRLEQGVAEETKKHDLNTALRRHINEVEARRPKH